MNSVTVSPKFQVVIPQQVRRSLGLKAGQKMVVLAYDNRIVLIPERPIQEARGSLKGMDTSVERDEEDRV
jgi:AbrB family looped-hinge helix DNA binding protein